VVVTAPNTSASSSSNNTVPSESNNPTTTSSNKTLITIISVSASVVAVLLIAILLLIANRRRKARQRRPEGDGVYNIPATGPMAAFSNERPYNPVPVNDTSLLYQPPPHDPQGYSGNPYSRYSPDVSQNDGMRYSGYEEGHAGNTVTAWGQYGLYPTGIPRPSSTGTALVAPSESAPSSASPNSQTRFIIPTSYNEPESPPLTSPAPSSTLMRRSTGPPPYASQFDSPSEPVPSMPPEFQSPSTSQPPAQETTITNFSDPPKRRYEGKKG
jgi:hypothetical protein